MTEHYQKRVGVPPEVWRAMINVIDATHRLRRRGLNGIDLGLLYLAIDQYDDKVTAHLELTDPPTLPDEA